MTWRIRPTNITGKKPVLHLFDPKIDLHLVTDLKTGLVDLYIGHIDPEKARLHLSFDVEETPIVEIERAFKHTARDIHIIGSVAQSMGLTQHQRHAILNPLWRTVDPHPTPY